MDADGVCFRGPSASSLYNFFFFDIIFNSHEHIDMNYLGLSILN